MGARCSAAVDFDGDVIIVALRCNVCFAVQKEPMDACANARDAVSKVQCLFCGSTGAMRMVKG